MQDLLEHLAAVAPRQRQLALLYCCDEWAHGAPLSRLRRTILSLADDISVTGLRSVIGVGGRRMPEEEMRQAVRGMAVFSDDLDIRPLAKRVGTAYVGPLHELTGEHLQKLVTIFWTDMREPSRYELRRRLGLPFVAL